MGKHTYIVVRHGISFANQNKTIVSYPSNGVKAQYGLTEEGKAQAAKSAALLREELSKEDSPLAKRPIYVISSPFSRAVQTAGIFLKTLSADGPSSTAAAATAATGNPTAPANPSAPTTATPALSPNTAMAPLAMRDRIVNKDLKPDIAYQLCERNFGEYELTPDTNYTEVWAEDALSEHSNTHGVEPLASVWARVSTLFHKCEMGIEAPSVILLVSHGDTLQITQTAFSGKPLTTHRSLSHLVQSEWRVLPPPPSQSAAVFKVRPVICKL